METELGSPPGKWGGMLRPWRHGGRWVLWGMGTSTAVQPRRFAAGGGWVCLDGIAWGGFRVFQWHIPPQPHGPSSLCKEAVPSYF